MGTWRWAAASRRGSSHEKTGERLQDANAAFALELAIGEVFVAVVSDGAGSARFGGQGASVTCRVFCSNARRFFQSSNVAPSHLDVQAWIDEVRDRIGYAASKRGLTRRDFACTLVAAIHGPFGAVVVHIGDGCAVVRDITEDRWIAPTWPEQGEYASTTYFVTDEPAARVRVSVHSAPIDGLALFTDGLERLVLDFAARQPHGRFFDSMSRPLHGLAACGSSRELSRHLFEYLGSEAVNARTDDDKSLLIAYRR